MTSVHFQAKEAALSYSRDNPHETQFAEQRIILQSICKAASWRGRPAICVSSEANSKFCQKDRREPAKYPHGIRNVLRFQVPAVYRAGASSGLGCPDVGQVGVCAGAADSCQAERLLGRPANT